ncbi:MAG: ABC transporter permease [Actinomycetota bacterium]|jgi:cell division transport system permease protein|nr:ABC transporter permease [Actinomycetota bacterium]
MRFNWVFFLKEALTNIRLNLLMSVTAVITTFVCILVLGMALLVSGHIEGIVGSVRQDVSVEAFFAPDATQERIDEVRAEVEGYPEVSEVTYISQEQALSDFKQTFEDNPEIYQDLGSDVLPASLAIDLENPSAAEAVAAKLREAGFSDSNLSYPQQTIERLNSVTSYMVWGLRAATALFLISSILLISNGIRVSIFARRQEIEVMKLVGASDGFVRTPFVFEGMLQSLVGATLAALVVVWFNYLFVDWSREALPFLPIASSAVSTISVLAILMAAGAAIGILGSFLSVTRFLRV